MKYIFLLVAICLIFTQHTVSCAQKKSHFTTEDVLCLGKSVNDCNNVQNCVHTGSECVAKSHPSQVRYAAKLSSRNATIFTAKNISNSTAKNTSNSTAKNVSNCTCPNNTRNGTSNSSRLNASSNCSCPSQKQVNASNSSNSSLKINTANSTSNKSQKAHGKNRRHRLQKSSSHVKNTNPCSIYISSNECYKKQIFANGRRNFCTWSGSGCVVLALRRFQKSSVQEKNTNPCSIYISSNECYKKQIFANGRRNYCTWSGSGCVVLGLRRFNRVANKTANSTVNANKTANSRVNATKNSSSNATVKNVSNCSCANSSINGSNSSRLNGSNCSCSGKDQVKVSNSTNNASNSTNSSNKSQSSQRRGSKGNRRHRFQKSSSQDKNTNPCSIFRSSNECYKKQVFANGRRNFCTWSGSGCVVLALRRFQKSSSHQKNTNPCSIYKASNECYKKQIFANGRRNFCTWSGSGCVVLGLRRFSKLSKKNLPNIPKCSSYLSSIQCFKKQTFENFRKQVCVWVEGRCQPQQVRFNKVANRTANATANASANATSNSSKNQTKNTQNATNCSCANVTVNGSRLNASSVNCSCANATKNSTQRPTNNSARNSTVKASQKHRQSKKSALRQKCSQQEGQSQCLQVAGCSYNSEKQRCLVKRNKQVSDLSRFKEVQIKKIDEKSYLINRMIRQNGIKQHILNHDE